MQTVVITGSTGDLGSVVVPRLQRDYRCLTPRRGESLAFDEPIYALVLLAGAFAVGSSPDDFARMLDANLNTAVNAVNAVLPRLETGGRIVAVSSIATLSKPGGIGAYVASKTALNAYIETLAKELAPRHITANAVLPASMDTPQNVSSGPGEALVPRAHVSEAIAYLLSEAGSRITGQLIAMS